MRVAAAAASLLTLVGLLAAVPASGRARPPARGFRVSGSIEGLRPGILRLIDLRVRNPYRRTMRLVSVSARVGAAGRHCTRWNLDVRPFRGRLAIPRARTRVVRLRVELQPTAAPECRGARFPLAFRARAVLE